VGILTQADSVCHHIVVSLFRFSPSRHTIPASAGVVIRKECSQSRRSLSAAQTVTLTLTLTVAQTATLCPRGQSGAVSGMMAGTVAQPQA
jgi:hypothetical protein